MRRLSRLVLIAVAAGLPQVSAPHSAGAQTGAPATAPRAAPSQAAPADTDALAWANARALAHANSLYVSLLEKTNQQLGLWTNPYGVAVATLEVLFAIGAIVVALLLFRQTHEHRAVIQESIAKYESILNTLVQDRLQQMQVQLDELITGARKELETASAGQRPNLERRILELEEKRDEIMRAERPLGGMPAGIGGRSTLSFSSLLSSRHLCASCGRELALPEPASLMAVTGEREVFCSNCGALNRI